MRLKPLYRIADTRWNVSGEFLTDGLNHGGIKSRVNLAVSLYTQCLKSVLYELDGPNGRLNRSLLYRNVSQRFTDIPSSRFIELWGGDDVMITSVNPVTYVRKDSQSLTSFSGVVPSRNVSTVNETTLVIDEGVFEEIRDNIHEPNGYSPTLQVVYRPGIADTLANLPDDLKIAIYAMARFKYDYRDTFAPSNTKRIDWVKSILSKYKMRHRNLSST